MKPDSSDPSLCPQRRNPECEPTSPPLFTRDNRSPYHPLVKQQEMAQIGGTAERLRQMGWHIVLTAGCFDMLHPGHLRMLQWAARQGTILIVGINDDESVARLKGAGRPVLSQTVRAEMVAGLECVSHVVLFPEPTPARLVELVRPHVYVKGEEYRTREIPEIEGVRPAIDLLFAPQIPGFSTSKMLRHIDRRFGGYETMPWSGKGTG